MSDKANTPDDVAGPGSDRQPAQPAGESASTPPAPPDKAQAELQSKLDQLNDRLLRVTAEFQNSQKRLARELAEARERTRGELLRQFLQVLDDLERAMAAAEQTADPSAIVEGVRITHEHLLALLAKFGVTPIPAAGEPFDPELHEALMRQPTRDVPPMTVLEEVTRGYRIDGRPLRPARVIVAVEPQEQEEE